VLRTTDSSKTAKIKLCRRSLYWTETPVNGKGRLMKCSVDGTEVEPVMLRPRQSSRTRPRPLRSSLPSGGSLGVNDSSISMVAFSSCSDMAVFPVFALDHTVTAEMSTFGSTLAPSSGIPTTMTTSPDQAVDIYIVDADTGDIWSLDSTGSRCRLVVNASELATKVSSSGMMTASRNK
jgi:hypothetical protein